MEPTTKSVYGKRTQSALVQVRVTEDERYKLDALALEAGCSLTDILRRCIQELPRTFQDIEVPSDRIVIAVDGVSTMITKESAKQLFKQLSEKLLN